MRSDSFQNSRRIWRSLVWRALGYVIFIALWQVLASGDGGLVFASPLDTARAAIALLSQKEFWLSGLLPTLWRVLAGFAMGIIAGGVLGTCAGLYPDIGRLLLPWRWVLSSVPGIVLVILAMLWCGIGSGMVVTIVALTVIPTVYLAMQDGIAVIDGNLCEMARAYRFSRRKLVMELYLPAVSAPLLSAGVVALGGGMRVAILGETLGASQGLGYTLAVARANLDTAGLYAVALLSMLLVSLIEATCLRSLRQMLQRRSTL